MIKIHTKIVLCCLLAVFFGLENAYAQKINVRGKVTDDEGRALPGVVVMNSDKSVNTVTNGNGDYTIKVTPEDILIYTMLGYKEYEENVGNKTRIDVTLYEDVEQLDDAVVVGYGYVRRVDLTGSVASVKTEEMMKAPVRSFEEALAGRVAGVQVNSTEGEPGSAINIIIRGQNSLTQENSPLYVIDGFPMESFDASSLNPADIESIDVLKDASSTAIYGARGANGVILVTTKSGHQGRTKVTYDGKTGFQFSTNKMELMNPYEFVKLQLELDPVYANQTYFRPTAEGFPTKSLDYYKNVQSIDWQDLCMQLAPINDHTLSVSGGSKSVTYSASLNYLGQEGIIVSSGYDRISGRLKLDVQANRFLKFGINANYSYTNQYGASVRMPSSSAEASLTQMYNMWGYRPVSGSTSVDNMIYTDEDTEILEMSVGNRYNPRLYLDNETKTYKQNHLNANAYMEATFAKYFKLRISGGTNMRLRVTEDFFNSKHPYSRKVSGTIKGVNGWAEYSTGVSLLNENTLTYTRTFNKKHNLNAMVGYTMQSYKGSSFRGTAWEVPRESLGISGIDEGVAQPLKSSKSSNALHSALFRVNYNYSRKYYLTFSMRADGSSKFPKANRWGYFPSGALSWRLSQEDFLKDNPVLTDAKIRASYGLTGNNRVGDFISMSSLQLNNVNGYSWNNDLVQGAMINTLGNDKLRWESTAAADIGVDLSFFDDRITVIADYYHKNTHDLLLNANLPLSSGYQKAMMNVGSVENQGFEFTLNTINILKKNFVWTSNFNISFNRSKVIELADGEEYFYSYISWHNDYANIPLYETRKGQPISMFVGMETDGLYQISDFTWQNDSDPSIPHGERTYVLKDEVPDNGMARNQIKPGYIKFKDHSGDGHVGDEDRRVLGNPNPLFVGGFSNTFTYKGFDLNVFLQFSYGNKIMNANRILFEGTYRSNLNQFASYIDRWSPENTDSPNHVPGGAQIAYYSDKTLEDGSYLRLKTVQLGYSIPAKYLKKTFISGFRVYASAQNLFTLTKYSGYDPEVSIYNSALTPGLDYLSYPRSRTFTFGLNISF